MKKLSDFKNEEALDLLVEILEPATEMMSDSEVIKKIYDKNQRMEGVKLMISRHKKAVIKLLSALDETPPDEYEFGFFVLPIRLLEVFNDKELLGFFEEQQMQASKIPSGSATENTEEKGH